MSRRRKGWFGDEAGVVRDCLIACLVGIGIFTILTLALWLAGVDLSGPAPR
jgi:hypothetical protein